MKKIQKRRWLLLISVILVTMSVYSFYPVKINSFAYYRKHYGVDRKAVLAVGKAYGVTPEEYSKYPGLFPLNYIEAELNWDNDREMRSPVYRSMVENTIKGYITKCELSSNETLYLFFSNWLSPKTIIHGEALVLSVFYELTPEKPGRYPEQVVEHIQVYDVGDSGGLLWGLVAPDCNPPARYVDREF